MMPLIMIVILSNNVISLRAWNDNRLIDLLSFRDLLVFFLYNIFIVELVCVHTIFIFVIIIFYVFNIIFIGQLLYNVISRVFLYFLNFLIFILFYLFQ
jgi:hypothetical protein